MKNLIVFTIIYLFLSLIGLYKANLAFQKGSGKFAVVLRDGIIATGFSIILGASAGAFVRWNGADGFIVFAIPIVVPFMFFIILMLSQLIFLAVDTLSKTNKIIRYPRREKLILCLVGLFLFSGIIAYIID